MEETSGELWQQRYKTEQLLEVGCPKCSATPHEWCDRVADQLSKRGQALLKAGTPPSHQERMWTRQGHAPHEFPALLAKQRPGRWDESAPRTKKSGRRARKAGAKSVPAYPIRYRADRICPECAILLSVEVVVDSPNVIGYRCTRGHKWLARTANYRTEKTGSQAA